MALSIKARARIAPGAAKSLGGSLIGAATVGMLRTTRYFDPVKTSNFFARVTKTIGPRLREHRIGRANLTAAFPEKSPEEIEQILMGVWDNLGRIGAEFAHIDHVWDYDRAHPENSRIEIAAAHHRAVRPDPRRRQAGADLRQRISPIGNCPRSPPSRMGSILRSSTAGRTLRPPTASSRRCARSTWAR